ncbi:UvrD-helicase domain-containing protein [Lentiprolixibacter aurantiacus]|uniref:DNA 3'-5' helicase n=1 Tax=Lentiprolixibacter aurantiacus TaxID=2993939 RepID=A0AAE3MJ57_9FLAO|nr:UvrD-helicase domain-containing protein [Lentiprolixibacter aurantiacus]
MQDSAFKIYNASAGSGKTFTLVREYLKIVLAPAHTPGFRQILAITFTNKAVNEMKQRILKSLYKFSTSSPGKNEDPLFLSLCEDLSCSPEQLQHQAQKALRYVLHNYAFFDVSTIDKFTHRLIRTFSRDLKLPYQFEVVLDLKELMQEVVGRLLSKAGSDAELTKTLIAFSLEKIDADKSWDIANDLNETGGLLFDENQLRYLEALGSKSAKEFRELKSFLREQVSASESEIKETALLCLDLIRTNGLERTDFKSGYFPKFLDQIVNDQGSLNFDAGWKVKFGEEPLYSQKVALEKKEILDTLLPRFAEHFNTIRNAFYRAAFHRNAYGNLVPLAILNALQAELEELSRERELLPISKFNQLIAREIKDQPAPYIYERLGEKYRHYFIDEFQDTSELQWNNLVPLISNALEGQDESGRKGSLFLVGDAKQAIYRWRGGKAEQFLNLINLSDPVFTISPEIRNLPRNYRSHRCIVEFNNEFFKITSPVLSNPGYQHLFNGGDGQQTNQLEDGEIILEFIDRSAEEEELAYGARIVDYIEAVRAKGYGYEDICILTRKIKQGVSVAEYLLNYGLPVISSETLLLSSSPEVRFCMALLEISIRPEEANPRFEALQFLNSVSASFNWAMVNDLDGFKGLLTDVYGIKWKDFSEMNAIDALEYAISCFKLNPDSNAYLNFLLDEALQVSLREGPDVAVFLNHWQNRKEKLSIVAPEGLDAITIMTIHKAKGLEFPVVIFPYANTAIYEDKNPKLWADVPETSYCGFQSLLLSKKKEMLHYPGKIADLFHEEQAKLELDAFNLLYVALTRSIAGLYIISEFTPGKENNTISRYSDLFVQYLQDTGRWDNGESRYVIGKLPEPVQKVREEEKPLQQVSANIYSGKQHLEKKLLPARKMSWDPRKEKAVAWGNLFHELMSHIIYETDVNHALSTFTDERTVEAEQLEILKEKSDTLVTHPELNIFFRPGNEVRNEAEIITENGLILRPDRLVFRDNKVSILDYKTGKPAEADKKQVREYAEALRAMGFSVSREVLVYIDEEIAPIFI